MWIRTLSATIDGQASWQDSINKNVNLQVIYENIIKVSLFSLLITTTKSLMLFAYKKNYRTEKACIWKLGKGYNDATIVKIRDFAKKFIFKSNVTKS